MKREIAINAILPAASEKQSTQKAVLLANQKRNRLLNDRIRHDAVKVPVGDIDGGCASIIAICADIYRKLFCHIVTRRKCMPLT